MNYQSTSSNLMKSLKVMQALMLVVTLVTMSFPVSAFATQDEEHGHTSVQICHKPDTGDAQVLTVDDDAVDGHLGHGDYLISEEHPASGCVATDDDDDDDENEGDGDISCTLTADPSTITEGDSSTLTLNISGEDAEDATAVVDNGVSGITEDDDTASVSPTDTTTYTATVTPEEEGDSVTCEATVTVNPKEHGEEENSCVAPSTLEQSGQRTIGVSPDGAGSQLQDIMNAASYSFDVDTDQTNDQVWNGTGNTVHFQAKFLAKFAGHKHVFGYMLNGGAFVPVFKDDASIGAPYASVPVNGTQTFDLSGVNDVVFAMVDVTSGQTYATKSSLNPSGTQYAVVYNPAGNTYAIAFEDLNPGTGDHDYNDLVVEVTVTGCENPDSATVIATKIVCDNESDLPNAMGSSHATDENTAANFLEEHPSCHLAKDWQFEWGNQGAGDPGRDFVGHADGYTTSGMTAEDGTVSMTIPLEDLTSVHMREVLQEGYIPFTFDTEHQSNANTVSAEFSCGTDGLNYDNFDFINNPVAGNTYYCVAWNVSKTPTCNPEINLLANSSFENPNVGTGSYSIVKDINLDAGSVLEWLVSWTSPQTSGQLGLEIQDHVAGDPALGAGDQFAELDGDHPVTISQTVPTVPGQEYQLSFKYSPRAGRNAADNTIVVKADGNVLGAALAEDGSANTNTAWADYTRSFVAGDNSTLVEFADTGTDTSYGGYLDNVVLHCVVPEETCPEGQHFNNDHICVPDEPECNVDAVTTLLSSDQGEGELITAVEGSGAAKLITSPHPAWADALDALWIWYQTSTSNTDATTAVSKTFVRQFEITGTPLPASVDVAADNGIKIEVNGNVIVDDPSEFHYAATTTYAIPAEDLVTGWNTIKFTVNNIPIEGSNGTDNPAGLLYKLVTHDNQCDVPENPQNGTLVIVKETSGGDGSFDFDVTGNESNTDADVTTEQGSGSTEVSLPAGQYNVTETVTSGWTLNSVSCEYDNESVGSPVANGEAISLSAGDTVTCTFHNTKVTEEITTTQSGGGTTGSGHKKKSSGEVLGASTCSPLLTDYLKFGWKNNEDQVKKLQQFLNDHTGSNLPISGFFGPMTFNAVKLFQKQYGNDVLIPWVGLPASGITSQNTPTGFVYQTTRWKINNIWCPGSEAFPTVLN